LASQQTDSVERMNKVMPAIGIGLILTACVSTTIPPRFTAATAGSARDRDLCDDFYRSQNQVALDELNRRSTRTDKDREALTSQRAVIGMSSSAALCLYGFPESINDTTTEAGRTEQWVYCGNYMASAKMRDFGKPSLFTTPESIRTACGSSAFLYFDNGVLTATQNVPDRWKPR
jgi:hypothetical protein